MITHVARLGRTLLLTSSIFVIVGCDDDSSGSVQAPAEASVASTVDGNADFTTLAAALDAAGLATVLDGPGPFTVFAPSDAAFATLPDGTVDALLQDTPALADLLKYHVVEGRVDAATVVGLTSATTLQGDTIAIEVNGAGQVVLNGSVTVTQVDLPASNGIIHVIDGVLMPPEDVVTPTNTIVDIVVGSDDFDTLEAAVIAANLQGTLSGPGPFTVFAPTDAAFDTLPAGTLDGLLDDIPALTDILTYHVVDGRVDAATVVTLVDAAAKNGVDIAIEVQGDDVILNGAVKVTMTDIPADNGIIHVIDAVLIPPPSIAEVVATDANFSTLLAAVDAANLGGALAGDATITVFAPTNAAFDLIPTDDLNALLADVPALTDVLTYHVIGGKFLAGDVVSAEYLTMFNGALAPISTDGGAFISTVAISATDIRARNGIIHVIDAVMMPPPTIAEIVSTDGDFSTLLAAVGAAELATTLDEDGPFTVFAPNDAAFDKVDGDALNALLADKAALTDVLLYHLVDGVVPASVAVTLDVATMKNGDDVTVDYQVANETLMVNQSLVLGADIYARNGIIHVIDTVLFPATN